MPNNFFKQLKYTDLALQCNTRTKKLTQDYRDAFLPCAASLIIRAGPLLTTSNAVIYDGDGNVVKLRGIGWFGFNTGYAPTATLRESDPVTGTLQCSCKALRMVQQAGAFH